MNFPYKITDTKLRPALGKVEKHWRTEAFKLILGNQREGERIPQYFNVFDQHYLLTHFGLLGFEYGNWMPQDERFEYLTGTALGLYDLSKITGFKPNQIGLQGLSIAFGARGSGKALAHYEPANHTINLTRFFSEREKSKNNDYSGGGKGSLGHEWGHALDFYLARKIKYKRHFLTEIVADYARAGSEISNSIKEISGIEKRTFDLMFAIQYQMGKDKKVHFSKFRKRVSDQTNNSEYWTSNIEMFARSFEAYLNYAGRKAGIKNNTLFSTKYGSGVYPTDKEMEKLYPLFRSFFWHYHRHVSHSLRPKQNR
jgi:hypothetical protein